MIKRKEKQQIVAFEKLEPSNALTFVLDKKTFSTDRLIDSFTHRLKISFLFMLGFNLSPSL